MHRRHRLDRRCTVSKPSSSTCGAPAQRLAPEDAAAAGETHARANPPQRLQRVSAACGRTHDVQVADEGTPLKGCVRCWADGTLALCASRAQAPTCQGPRSHEGLLPNDGIRTWGGGRRGASAGAPSVSMSSLPLSLPDTLAASACASRRDRGLGRAGRCLSPAPRT